MRGRREVFEMVSAELENVRAAWSWAIAHRQLDELVASAWAIDSIYQHHVRQARAVFAEAADGLDDQDPAHHRALGHVLVYLAHYEFFERGGDPKAMVERALRLLEPLDDRVGVMRALVRRGFIEAGAGKKLDARATWRSGLTLARRYGTARDICVFLTILAGIEQDLAPPAEVEAFYAEALDEVGRLGGEVHLAHLKRYAGWYFLERGNLARADELFEEALTIARRLGDRRLEPWAYLIRRSLDAGDHALAEATARDCVSVFRACGKRSEEVGALVTLGRVLMAHNEHDEAMSTTAAALRIAWEFANDSDIVQSVVALGDTALALDRPHEAATFLGTVLGRPQGTGDQAEVDRLVGLIRTRLGTEEAETSFAAGQRLAVVGVLDRLAAARPG
jgi:tetratricopeptide (TPR) repeat protein